MEKQHDLVHWRRVRREYTGIWEKATNEAQRRDEAWIQVAGGMERMQRGAIELWESWGSWQIIAPVVRGEHCPLERSTFPSRSVPRSGRSQNCSS